LKRPRILVLAGVNGAGKSSVGGGMLEAYGLTWFNPDAFSRELMARSGLRKEDADGAAWAYGKAKLEEAMANRSNFAFETTLGANTIPRLLGEAAETHDVIVIFRGLASVQMHIDRVKLRVRHGGHDIPEEQIRKRWESSRQNLIEPAASLGAPSGVRQQQGGGARRGRAASRTRAGDERRPAAVSRSRRCESPKSDARVGEAHRRRSISMR
jgi:predicted ABC-type ATPase